eukprot:scaffold51248_cov68-Phaeocystis_antarctica.AAC.6
MTSVDTLRQPECRSERSCSGNRHRALKELAVSACLCLICSARGPYRRGILLRLPLDLSLVFPHRVLVRCVTIVIRGLRRSRSHQHIQVARRQPVAGADSLSSSRLVNFNARVVRMLAPCGKSCAQREHFVGAAKPTSSCLWRRKLVAKLPNAGIVFWRHARPPVRTRRSSANFPCTFADTFASWLRAGGAAMEFAKGLATSAAKAASAAADAAPRSARSKFRARGQTAKETAMDEPESNPIELLVQRRVIIALLTPHYSLLTTHHSPLTTHRSHSPLTTHRSHSPLTSPLTAHTHHSPHHSPLTTQTRDRQLEPRPLRAAAGAEAATSSQQARRRPGRQPVHPAARGRTDQALHGRRVIGR